MGADYLAYTLLDIVVDQYFVVLEKLGERIEVLEGRLLADPGAATLQKIQKLKKEMLLLRKWIWPLREVISSLERGEFPGIQESTRIYLRDVYDHTIQVMDTIEIYRDMLSGMLDIYLSSLNNRMNAVMKVLTIIPPSSCPDLPRRGVRMNLSTCPSWTGRGHTPHPAVMAFVAILMLTLFRRKKWL
jgi:magnesium transporter